MNFRIVDIHAATEVKVRAAQATVIIPTQEIVKLSKDEVGFLEGKFSDHQKGVYMQGGIINPGWTGYLTVELIVFGECDIKVGQEVAHAIIIRK